MICKACGELAGRFNICAECAAEEEDRLSMRLYDAERALEIATNALQKYANGNALLLTPEKAHLYAQDFPWNSPEWRARSMSDWSHKLLAEQTLNEIKELGFYDPPPPCPHGLRFGVEADANKCEDCARERGEV